jgi:hypothetical protein
VTNGPKDHVGEHEDFDSWRTQHHQVIHKYPWIFGHSVWQSACTKCKWFVLYKLIMSIPNWDRSIILTSMFWQCISEICWLCVHSTHMSSFGFCDMFIWPEFVNTFLYSDHVYSTEFEVYLLFIDWTWNDDLPIEFIFHLVLYLDSCLFCYPAEIVSPPACHVPCLLSCYTVMACHCIIWMFTKL